MIVRFCWAVTIVAEALYHDLERGVDIYSHKPDQYLGMYAFQFALESPVIRPAVNSAYC